MEKHLVTQLVRIREWVKHIVNDYRWNGRRTDATALEQLAYVILETARMRYQLSPKQMPVVDIAELAFRLRETKRDIKKTLELLERHGIAKRCNLPQLWELRVADLDQRTSVSDFVRSIYRHTQ